MERKHQVLFFENFQHTVSHYNRFMRIKADFISFLKLTIFHMKMIDIHEIVYI